MLQWITENVGTVIIGAVLLIAVAVAVAVLVKNRKKGRGNCSCGCAGCPMSGNCGRSDSDGRSDRLK